MLFILGTICPGKFKWAHTAHISTLYWLYSIQQSRFEHQLNVDQVTSRIKKIPRQEPSHVRRISGLGGLSPQPQMWSSYSSFQSPRKILTKMSAFEAFSSNLDAEPFWGLGAEPLENFDKIECFWSIFQWSWGRALMGVRGAWRLEMEPLKNFDNFEFLWSMNLSNYLFEKVSNQIKSAFEAFSSNLEAGPWWGSGDGAPGKFWQKWVLLKHFPAI